MYLTYRIKLKASKKPVILEYVTAEAIAGTTLSVLSGSFLTCKIDFIASGIDAKPIREWTLVKPRKIPETIIAYAAIINMGNTEEAVFLPSIITKVRRPFDISAS